MKWHSWVGRQSHMLADSRENRSRFSCSSMTYGPVDNIVFLLTIVSTDQTPSVRLLPQARHRSATEHLHCWTVRQYDIKADDTKDIVRYKL